MISSLPRNSKGRSRWNTDAEQSLRQPYDWMDPYTYPSVLFILVLFFWIMSTLLSYVWRVVLWLVRVNPVDARVFLLTSATDRILVLVLVLVGIESPNSPTTLPRN